jgi:hypothetical protein
VPTRPMTSGQCRRVQISAGICVTNVIKHHRSVAAQLFAAAALELSDIGLKTFYVRCRCGSSKPGLSVADLPDPWLERQETTTDLLSSLT